MSEPGGPHEPEEPLELQERPPRPEAELPRVFSQEPFAAPTPPKRRGGMWLLAVLLAAGILATFALQRGFRFGVEGEVPVVTIDSDPSGAEVTIDGRSMGNTPLLFQNRYPARPIPLELRAPGFKRWTGSFNGDQEVKLEIKLEQERH